MSSVAEMLVNQLTGEWKPVSAIGLTEHDRTNTFRCICCKAPSVLVISSDGEKKNYFRSAEHSVNCEEARGRKIIHISVCTRIDLDSILLFEDKDPSPRNAKATEDEISAQEKRLTDEDDSEGNFRVDPNSIRTIRSANAMFREFVEQQINSRIDDFTSREINSIFLCRETIQHFKDDWGSPEKLVILKRFAPKNLKFKIPIPEGYLLLRDAYSSDDEDAIYFAVKMTHPEHNKNFRTRIFGDANYRNGERLPGRIGQDKHKNIVIFARWRRVAHKHYRIYQAELNSRQIGFVNAPDV